MSDTEQVIQLEGDESIHAVRGMVAASPARRVVLVIPKQHYAFQRPVRLKLLARQARSSGVPIALVTFDSRVRDLARQLNISTFSSVEAARRSKRWRAPDEGAVSNSKRSSDSFVPGRGRPEGTTRVGLGGGGADSQWSENIMLAGLLFGMMIILGSMLLLVVPSAQITLVPRQIPIEMVVPVFVDPSAQEVDVFNNIVPAELVSIPVQGALGAPATGRRDVPAARAQGEVTFLNVTGEPVTFPENTIVSTSSGAPVRFRTMQTVTLSGEIDARATTPIEAINPGPAGNVRALQINLVEGVAASQVRVLNESPTEGGDVQQRAVVTKEDQAQLFAQLRQVLLSQGRLALEREVQQVEGSDQPARYLLPESVGIEIIAETYSASIDEQADALNLDLRARVSGIVVERPDVERLGLRALREEVPEHYRLLEDGFNVVIGEARRDENGLLVLESRVQGIAGAMLSAEQIRGLVRGRPFDEANALLLQELPLAADPRIELSPDWWNRMPYLPLRIFIRVGVLGDQSSTP